MDRKDALELAMRVLEFRITDFILDHQDNENMRTLIKEYNEAIDLLEDLQEDLQLADNKEFIQNIRKLVEAVELTDFDITKVSEHA